MDLDSTHPTVASAMDMALRWLAARGRSRAQVEARLRQAGFSDEIAAAVGARLVELGILSDRDFALAGVETGLRRGLSRPYLQHQLEGRGVAARDAMWALDVAGNQEPDAVRALELAEAWARAHPSLVDAPGGRAMRRLGAMLLRKGYDEELVGDVCRAVLGDPSGILDEGTGAEGSTEGVELD
jgi:SOS response regulatory protein OraA/RecX